MFCGFADWIHHYEETDFGSSRQRHGTMDKGQQPFHWISQF